MATRQTTRSYIPFADTVLINGTVITVDRSFRIAQAVAISGERIVAVGTEAEVKTLVGPQITVIDLRGKTLLPGFIDTHGHIGLFGLETRCVSLAGAYSLATIQQRIA